MDWTKLRWAVPVAILVVGYWLLAPLVAPALVPTDAPVAEAPVAVVPPAGKPAAVAVRSTVVVPPGGTPPGASVVTAAAAPTSTPVPAPTASPTPAVYRASPVENLKVEPRAVEIVRLGRLDQGTQVRMTLAVRFNVGISNLSGTPDLDVQVAGPTGTIGNYPNARDGQRVDFQAPATGEYELRLDNTRSRVNAKRVTVQFG